MTRARFSPMPTSVTTRRFLRSLARSSSILPPDPAILLAPRGRRELSKSKEQDYASRHQRTRRTGERPYRQILRVQITVRATGRSGRSRAPRSRREVPKGRAITGNVSSCSGSFCRNWVPFGSWTAALWPTRHQSVTKTKRFPGFFWVVTMRKTRELDIASIT
jgi:hypothetical protein